MVNDLFIIMITLLVSKHIHSSVTIHVGCIKVKTFISTAKDVIYGCGYVKHVNTTIAISITWSRGVIFYNASFEDALIPTCCDVSIFGAVWDVEGAIGKLIECCIANGAWNFHLAGHGSQITAIAKRIGANTSGSAWQCQ